MMVATRLWLVRHGQTDWNAEGRYQGQADPPLNAAGLSQARALAARLQAQAVRWAALYSSDLQRAWQTADILGGCLDLPVCAEARLREIHQGEWDGQLISDIVQRYPQAWAERHSRPATFRPPGGESTAEVAARVAAAVDEIARRHPAKQVLVVSHGFALATLLCRARGLDLGQVFELVPDNADPHVIDWPTGAREADA